MDILKAVHSARTFDEFLTRLKDHEVLTATKYVLTDSLKSFRDKNVKLSQDRRLHWLQDVPYFHLGTRKYLCHRGKDTNVFQKKRAALERDRKAREDDVIPKITNRSQRTKKVNCPAAVYVTRIIRMPEFKITKEMTKNRKHQMSVRIKKKISESAEVGEECYIFNLPNVGDHKIHLRELAPEATEQSNSKVSNSKRRRKNPE